MRRLAIAIGLAATGCMSLAQQDAPRKPWDGKRAECSRSYAYPAVAAVIGGLAATGATFVIVNDQPEGEYEIVDGEAVALAVLLPVAVIELIDTVGAYRGARRCREYEAFRDRAP